ncbi:MAG TPA: protein arginine kinase [bacterium]|nr:protein arginine kinase [bacterium]HPQ65932.1 protein arginine kinase [bacterium]
MSLAHLFRGRAGWLSGSGPDNDIAFSSRLRLARNLRGERFPQRASDEARRQVFARVVEAVKSCPALGNTVVIRMEEITKQERQLLVERRLISPALSSRYQGGVVIGEKELVSVIVNEEDHLRIQVLLPGFDLGNCWKVIDLVEGELSACLDFEFSPDLGYLTACPSNVGTGMRASVMLHLPGLTMSDELSRVLRAADKLGITVRGMYGEGSGAVGHLFQFSNQSTLGCSEERIISDLERIVGKIIAHERAVRQKMLGENRLFLEDRVFRSLGVLSHARLLNSEESLNLLSGLRLGRELGMLPELPTETVNDLFIVTQPAHLQALAGRDLEPPARDSYRASLVRSRIRGE